MDGKRENRIENKVDSIANDIASINVTLAKQSIILDEHQRRSLANEAAVEILKSQHNMIVGAFKLISLFAALAAAIELFVR